MEVQEMISLIKAVSDYGMTELKLDNGTIKLSLKKECVQNTVMVSAEKPNAAFAESGAKDTRVPAEEDTFSSDQIVVSPLVGTFYSSPSPEAESFVKAGDTVKKGQILGIIEAMKLMNEIESDYDGVVEAVLVKNEDVVEYGQPLFRIR